MKNMRFIPLIIGAILILINGIWIALEGKAIIISSYPVAAISELKGTWGRISFGIPSLVSGTTVFLWLSLATVNLLLVLMLYFRPKSQFYYGLSILLLSLVSFSIGGGFFIGMILTIVGSLSAMENKPFKETFLGKMFRAARLDTTLYENLKKNPESLRNAALIIIFLNILTGLGNGLYLLHTNSILNVDPMFPERGANILLKGEILFDLSVLGITATYVGLAVIKWLLLSLIIYFVTRIAGAKIEFESMAHCVAFAYSPIAIQLFMPFVLFNQPFLTETWPLTFFLLSNLWMGIALISAVKKISDLSLARAFGSTILAGATYYLINYAFIEPRFPTQGIRFITQQVEILEVVLSVAVLLALVLGVFSMRARKTTSASP